MPVVEAVARIAEIQTTLIQLATAAPNKTSAAAFAKQINAVSPSASAGTTAATPVETGTSTSGASGQSIVDAARKYVGVPYVFGGEDRSGMDCSGLVQRALKDVGIDAPRLAHEQAKIGTEVSSLANAKPGDLLVTKNANHIVIYAGDGMVVHAPYAGRNVSYQKNWLTDADLQTIRRITPSAGASSTASSATTPITRSQITDLIAQAQSNLVSGGVKSSTGTANSLLALIPGATS